MSQPLFTEATRWSACCGAELRRSRTYDFWRPHAPLRLFCDGCGQGYDVEELDYA